MIRSTTPRRSRRPRSNLLRATLAGAVLAVLGQASVAGASDHILRAEFVLDAPVAAVWAAWTTEAGITSFFAPGCHVESHVDGAYEIFFAPGAPAGQRGADGMRILGYEPQKRLSFTWNAPPRFASIRSQRTQVVVELEAVGTQQTRLRFTHQGWGDGPEWDPVYAYFDAAWGGRVLPFLKYRFAKGPIDWKAMPEVEPLGSLRLDLVPAAPAPSPAAAMAPAAALKP
jgi:uncharacterized protein YndB with AHSA1/START domain